jgi:hypothetical protein
MDEDTVQSASTERRRHEEHFLKPFSARTDALLLTITGGPSNTRLTAPDGSDWVLRLKVQRVPEPAPHHGREGSG